MTQRLQRGLINLCACSVPQIELVTEDISRSTTCESLPAPANLISSCWNAWRQAHWVGRLGILGILDGPWAVCCCHSVEFEDLRQNGSRKSRDFSWICTPASSKSRVDQEHSRLKLPHQNKDQRTTCNLHQQNPSQAYLQSTVKMGKFSIYVMLFCFLYFLVYTSLSQEADNFIPRL